MRRATPDQIMKLFEDFPSLAVLHLHLATSEAWPKSRIDEGHLPYHVCLLDPFDLSFDRTNTRFELSLALSFQGPDLRKPDLDEFTSNVTGPSAAQYKPAWLVHPLLHPSLNHLVRPEDIQVRSLTFWKIPPWVVNSGFVGSRWAFRLKAICLAGGFCCAYLNAIRLR